MNDEHGESPWVRLQDWLHERTHGAGEVYGQVSFGSDALPAWGFRFDLRGRLKPGGIHGEPPVLSFEEVEVRASAERWVRCWVEEGAVRVLASPTSGTAALAGIVRWIVGGCRGDPTFELGPSGAAEAGAEMEWLQAWATEASRDEDGECFGVRLHSLPFPGWMLRVDLEEFGLEDREGLEFSEARSRDEWLHARTRSGMFEATCGPRQLDEVVRRFREWVEGSSDT